MKTQQKKPGYVIGAIGQNDNPLESLKGISSAVSDSFFNDLLKKTPNAAIEQIGMPNFLKGGDMHPGQEISLKKHEEPKAESHTENHHVEPGFHYKEKIMHHGPSHEEQELAQKYQEIRSEIQHLAETQASTSQAVAQITTEVQPGRIGTGSVSFVEGVLSTLISNKKVEESSSWLGAVRGRDSKAKWKKMSGNMSNTSVTLSNERQVATSVG